MTRARLIKRATADGLMEVEDHVPLGKVYDLDPFQMPSMATFWNIPHAVEHTKEVVWVREDDGSVGCIPTELLELLLDA